MKILKSASFVVAVVSLAACSNNYDEYDNSYILDNKETMTLTSSETSMKLVENTPADEPVVTFTWTPAREMPEEYLVTYVTMLDLKVNQFGTSTVIRNVEDDGVFSRSFTTAQLQSYITNLWGQPVSEDVTLSFKVIAKWSGGDKFIMPESRTVDVDVRPYRPVVFDADVVYISGSAKTGISRQIVTKTLENDYVYAIVSNLKEGGLTIPVSYEGLTQYISPQGDGTFQDGVTLPAKMLGENEDGTAPDGISWQIPSSGDYRIVIDMLDKTVTIYSPENKFNEPFTVTWQPNSNASLTPITTVVTNLWLRGATAGWAKYGKDLKLTQSLADPQVLVYKGDPINNGDGRTSFSIISKYVYDGNGDGSEEEYNVNNAYQFAPARIDSDGDGIQDKGSDYTQNLALGTWMPMSGGTDIRGNYFKCNKGTNFIVFDLRNMRIRFETK